ncbi:Uncharacterised protein [[Actinobacillus] rossii]|uniref:DUF4372 domain-containing protein n=1 Tax=[Actinobacillus] rossii TaxID=123820 RepID=A0A380U419_9PAST|nr:Uncharacterised protein [[Actinobacillus] rossii]
MIKLLSFLAREFFSTMQQNSVLSKSKYYTYHSNEFITKVFKRFPNQ